MKQPIQKDLAKIDRAENFEIALSNSLNRTYSEVLKLSPVKELVDVLTYRFAFHNIKLAVKEKILQGKFWAYLFKSSLWRFT